MSGEPTVDGLAEDVAELKAIVHGYASELELHKTWLDELRDGGPLLDAGDDSEADGQGSADGKHATRGGKKGKGGGEQAAPVPPFILRLDGLAFDGELGALVDWVAKVLVPVYCREPGSLAPWCPQWWEHAEAVARLHGLWLAWQELTAPETGGRLGPGVWHRDYLDPCMSQLRDATGPFAACMVNPNKPQHRVLAPPMLEESPYPPPAAAGEVGG